MNKSIGSDNQVFVREAMKACRASSGGAAGPVPAVAARMRLLLGQMMPQTFNNITMPYMPPIPNRIRFVTRKALAANGHRRREKPDETVSKDCHQHEHDDCKHATVLDHCRNFLDQQNSITKEDDRIPSQKSRIYPTPTCSPRPERIRVIDIRRKDVHRVVSQPNQNRDSAPQRKYQSARPSRSGLTFFFVSASIPFWKGTFTRLKK
jgi:hypothetical protein